MSLIQGTRRIIKELGNTKIVDLVKKETFMQNLEPNSFLY